ncbi:MAG: hypothetical protein AAGA40_18360 [Cyanobacteria bacterium P01_E01_bin.45]
MSLQKLNTTVLVLVTVFYAYGALMHVLNMLGLAGFDWLAAPVKWQILDAVYLALDLLVCVGLSRRFRPSVYAFYGAALTQIGLYTVLRSWITDVPEAFALSSKQASDLNFLVAFHAICLLLVSASLAFGRSSSNETPADL